jgi:hypothetical protein
MRLKFSKVKMKTEQSVCIIDNVGGSYVSIARELTKYFGKVFYHSVNKNPFPMYSADNTGIGYDGVENIIDFWSNIDQIDIFIFPDIYFKDWGNHLRKMGKKVWGGCQSEDLETDRKLFKTELESVGLPTIPTTYITGITNLINYLKTKEDKWIKISYYRGNMETYHHINMNQSSVWLENLKISLGPLGEEIEFVVEDSLDCIVETGSDGWTINGEMCNNQIWGIETKDCGYIGTHTTKDLMPKPVIEVNNKFSSVLKKYNHTGFYSNEIRVGKDGNNYFTDPCMRAGSPPSNTYLSMINNWDEIIINGCNGEIVEPTYAGKYGCEVILKSTYCFNNFMAINIPAEYKDNIRLKGSFRYKDLDYIIPFDQVGIKEMKEFGSIVVIGDNVDEILSKASEIGKSLECYGLMFDSDALNKTKKSIEEITKVLGIEF